jgi:sugar lactone lactonase YvrE
MAGCSHDATAPSFNAAPAATSGAYSRPSDAVPNADGTTFYFVANGDHDSEAPAGVFSTPAAGGDVTILAQDLPLVSPFGISISADDSTLFVTDPGAEDANDAQGQIFSLPASGGTPVALMGAAGTRPRSLDVFKDPSGVEQIAYGGLDPSDGSPGLLQIPSAGGAMQVVAKGDPFRDPSGVVIAKNGDAYVVDSSGDSDSSAQVVLVHAGAASVFYTGLSVGFPAGVSLPTDESAVLVSGIDPATGYAIVYAIDIATKNVATFQKGIEGNLNSAGLHRARNANIFSWADSTAGDSAQGIVYRVELK